MTTPPLVVVEWHDAWYDHDVGSVEELRADYKVLTVGYLIHEDEQRVAVAAEILPDGDGFRSVTLIQRASIETRTPLMELPEELRNGLESGTPTDPPAIGKATF